MNCNSSAHLSALTLVLLLGGCAVRPYVRPEIASPPAYRGDPGQAEPGGMGSLADLRWQDFIQDEALSKLIGEALTNNFDVQIAATRVLEARAQASIARAARFPSIDAVASYEKSKSPDMDGSTQTIFAGFSWEIDLWHRIRNTAAAARAQLLAEEQARRAVLQGLVSDVAIAYFLLRDLDMEIEITQRALALRDDSLELVQLRLNNGYSSEIDLRQAEVLVKSARTSLTSLELQREQTENRIAVLVGRNPAPIARGRSLLEQGLSATLPPGLPSALLERRPDIQQAEQQLIRDHVLVDVAKAAYFPSLTLTATTGYASSALMGLASQNGFWSLLPATTVPVFRAGAIRAGIRAAEARRAQSVLTYRKTVQQAFREVVDSLAAERAMAELRKQQESLVDSLRKGVELADLAYKGGVVSYLEYLDAERQLLDAELLLVQIRRDELSNFVVLYRSLGGGW